MVVVVTHKPPSMAFALITQNFQPWRGAWCQFWDWAKPEVTYLFFWDFEAPLHLLKPEEKADYLPVAVNFYPKY